MTDNMERLEHAQLVIQMEAGALALIIASKRGLNVPQLIKTKENLREAIRLIDDILDKHFATKKTIKS